MSNTNDPKRKLQIVARDLEGKALGQQVYEDRFLFSDRRIIVENGANFRFELGASEEYRSGGAQRLILNARDVGSYKLVEERGSVTLEIVVDRKRVRTARE